MIELSGTNPLLGISDFVLKKKILSLREHYDLEDRTGTKLGEVMAISFSYQPNLSSLIVAGRK
jgi:hypothetical protein